MRIPRDTAAFVFFCLLLLLCINSSAYAETSLTVFGVGAIEEDNLAKAEQLALEDAFSKAILHVALKYVPNSSSLDLIQTLPEYISSRGMQDITQYQITSRSQQYDVLQLSVDIKLDDESLKDWLYARTLTIPYELRPEILLMISTLGPGDEDVHEWWLMKGKMRFSSFESQFAKELRKLGDHVLDIPDRRKRVIFRDQEPEAIAHALQADLLLKGTISYTPVLDTLYECTLEISLIDPVTEESLGTWSISRRGDFDIPDMNSLMIDEVIKPVRARINHIILSLSPVVMKKTLCIEGIKDYVTYQSMVNSLSAMESISSVSITTIQGHMICHTIKIKGSLFDIMENLKREQIADADIVIEDDTAHIRIINN